MSRVALTPKERVRRAMHRVEDAATYVIYQAELFGAEATLTSKRINRRALLSAARDYGTAMRNLARLQP